MEEATFLTRDAADELSNQLGREVFNAMMAVARLARQLHCRDPQKMGQNKFHRQAMTDYYMACIRKASGTVIAEEKAVLHIAETIENNTPSSTCRCGLCLATQNDPQHVRESPGSTRDRQREMANSSERRTPGPNPEDTTRGGHNDDEDGDDDEPGATTNDAGCITPNYTCTCDNCVYGDMDRDHDPNMVYIGMGIKLPRNELCDCELCLRAYPIPDAAAGSQVDTSQYGYRGNGDLGGPPTRQELEEAAECTICKINLFAKVYYACRTCVLTLCSACHSARTPRCVFQGQ